MLQEQQTNKKRVMVFGVFDGLHEGHLSFLQQARELGEELIVVLARDESVLRLKKHAPRFPLAERIRTVEQTEFVHMATSGDETEGTWGTVHAHRPDIVALGYDQTAMAEQLAFALPSFPFSCQIVILKPFQPHTYHSSLLYPVLKQDGA